MNKPANSDGLSLIVPNHNGAKVIESSVEQYYNLFSSKFKNFEIIVVCNACIDNSVEICKKLEKRYPLTYIIGEKKGKGHALIAGFNRAKFNYIGFLDADNPFNLEKISELTDKLEKYDIAIASKYLRGKARSQDSFLRRLISLGGSIVSKFLFNLNFRDTQAGAKFFRKKVWQLIDKNFISTGFDFDIEFLYKARKSKFKIVELFIPFKYEEFSTVRLRYLPGMLFRLIKLRFLK